MFSLLTMLLILVMVFLILKALWFGILSIGSFLFLAAFTTIMLLGTIFDGGTIVILMILLITGVVRGRKPQG